jgi:Na+-driven multidrug efflux pump
VFTGNSESERIASDLIVFIRIMCIFYPGVALGMFSSSMFQGTGKGTYSLVVTIFRTLIMAPPLAWLFAYQFNMGLAGLWWGIVIGNLSGSTVSFVWAIFYVRRLQRELEVPSPSAEA